MLTRFKYTLYYTEVVFFSNLIMLLLMTYNFGIILAVLSGNGLGFYFFSLKDSKMRPQYQSVVALRD
jgi:hypothetical protein